MRGLIEDDGDGVLDSAEGKSWVFVKALVVGSVFFKIFCSLILSLWGYYLNNLYIIYIIYILSLYYLFIIYLSAHS